MTALPLPWRGEGRGEGIPVQKPEAALVIIEGTNNTILGVSRPNDPTDFGLPGGSVEPGETPEAGALRELFEETGLTATKLEKLEQVTYRDRTIHCFRALEYTGSLRSSDEGAVAWVTWETLGRGKYGDYNRRLELTLVKK
jgi:8-oxo-dGTP pyrophosphatase MutT (NUDIX family)